MLNETYSVEAIQAILEYWDQLNEIKTFRPAVMNSSSQVTSMSSLDENQTLLSRHKANTPRGNSNAHIEALSCITADMESALNHLTGTEKFALTARYTLTDYSFSESMLEIADLALAKVYYYLNEGPYYRYAE